MARWPSPCPIPNLLPIWHKANSQLITTKRSWDTWKIHTPYIINCRPGRKTTGTVHSPGRRPSSFLPSRTRRSLPNLSYSRFTPLSRCDRSPRSALRHQKTTHCHRTLFSISPCQRRSGRRGSVRRRNRFDRPSWNENDGFPLLPGSDDGIRS